jgi:small subunit ribosomal protein S20
VPNIKQQEKRMRLAERQTLRNRQVKSALRTLFKKLEANVGEGNGEEAARLALELSSKIDQATAKGVIHRNAAARRKSRVAHTLARLGG